MAYTIKYACVCNIGKKRKQNQDNYICGGSYRDNEKDNLEPPIYGKISSERPEMVGVFDGMGGESSGEIASILAAEEAASIRLTDKPASDLLRLCFTANERICRYADDHDIDSMGTTAAILLFAEKSITLCNIGDSKIYRCNKSGIQQISVDHVVNLIEGVKAPLSQNLGIPSEEMLIDPYVAELKYQTGDVYLIASDGLTDMLSEEKIYSIVSEYSVEEGAQRLLEEALAAGGRDNITIIVCEVEKKTLWKWITARQ